MQGKVVIIINHGMLYFAGNGDNGAQQTNINTK